MEIQPEIPLEDTSLFSPEIPPRALEFSDALRDITTDRARALYAHQDPAVISDISLAQIPESEREAALINLKTLHHLNGHRGSMVRDRVFSGTTPLAVHLRMLYEWSKSPADAESLGAEVPEGLAPLADSPEHLYELLTFLEKNPDVAPEEYALRIASATATALQLPEGKTKWVDGISPTFNTPNREEVFTRLFHEVGFIPEELTTKKAFQKVPATALIASVDTLRKLEDGEYGKEARFERARLLNAMIAGGNLELLKAQGGTITLDANGIFINTGALHAHLPYGLLEERALVALREAGWLSDEEHAEAALRASAENNSCTQAETESKKQLVIFCEAIGKSAESSETIVTDFLANPEDFARQIVFGNHVMPDALIQAVADSGMRGIAALMRFGEAVGVEVAEGGTSSNKYAYERGFDTHELLHQPEEEYQTRAKILGSPKYYNAHKTLAAILPLLPQAGAGSETHALRGAYKRAKNGDQHSFVEVLHDGGAARVLINEDKQLNAPLRSAFEQLPLYEREDYENLERVLHSYSYFASEIEVIASGEYKKSGHHLSGHRYRKAAESILYFLLAHFTPNAYHSAQAEFNRVWKESYDRKHHQGWKPEDKTQDAEVTCDDAEFLRIAYKAKDEYRLLLEKSIGNKTNFVENFMPEVQKQDIEFGPTFAQEAEEKTVSYGRDLELSEAEATTRVVSIDYKKNDKTHTVPFHIEEAALDGLRLPKGRPFLNIIGGARQMERGDVDTLGLMSSAVLAVAHKHKMNVAVPGTQSGIGLTFGRENLRYKRETAHLPHLDTAHLFAVSPGGNTYFPGNPYLDPANKQQTYAIAPVDSIITPFSVNWDAQGAAKRNSPYISHVEYMEALYARLAAGQKRLTVIGNGGLYAIMEITEAYQNGFPLMFIEDSGRLGQVLGTMRAGAGLNRRFETDEECYRVVQETLELLPTQVRDEFETKDFGKAELPKNEDEAVYREYFYRLLRVMSNQHRHNTLHVKLAQLEAKLDAYYNFEADNDARYPLQWI